jgi:hypothetical protein
LDSLGQFINEYKGYIKLSKQDRAEEIKRKNTNLESIIIGECSHNIFILKAGDIENYTNTEHGELASMIYFCENELSHVLTFFNEKSTEIREILNLIAK